MVENETRWEGVWGTAHRLGQLGWEATQSSELEGLEADNEATKTHGWQASSQGQEAVGREVDTEETGWPRWLRKGLL